MSDVVNTGAADNDGRGDRLRSAFQRINVRLQEMLGLFTRRGVWATGVAYKASPARDWVIQGGQAYAAVQDHTSGVFATDLAAGKWIAVDLLQLTNDLYASTGAGIVGFIQSAAGAVARTVQSKLQESLDAQDFGVDATGATNSTVALKKFFDACIASGKRGHIGAGTYLVTAGELAFDCNFTDTQWPTITTAGYRAVTFLRADATDAAMISLTNGTATGPSGRYWLGGALGGITFSQNGQTKTANQHGLLLRGVWATKFGWMRTNDAGGSCVHLPQFLYSGNNPDPYAVTACNFEGIEANRCNGFALDNRNWVGLNGCTVELLRAIECVSGGWYGFGAGNSVHTISMGSVKGWALDDGTATSNTGGSPSRITADIAELDDCQYGIRLNKTLVFEARQFRFVCRKNFSALNPGEGYWPRTAISIAGGTLPAVGDVKINAIFRIEAGGVKADLGQFINMHGVASTDIDINLRLLNNAGISIAKDELYTGVSSSSSSLLALNREIIFDSRIKPIVIVRSFVGAVVASSGFAGYGSKMSFPTVAVNLGGHYDTSLQHFDVPYTRPYRMEAKVAFSSAVGTRVRMAFMADNAGSVGIAATQIHYSVDAAVQHYTISAVMNLTAGHKIFLSCEQNTGAGIGLEAPFGAGIDLVWSIEAL